MLALIIICGVFSAVPFAAEAEHTAVDPEDGTYAPGQVIVMFKDGEVTIVDVTMIQRWLVELPAADGIGKPIG